MPWHSIVGLCKAPHQHIEHWNMSVFRRRAETLAVKHQSLSHIGHMRERPGDVWTLACFSNAADLSPPYRNLALFLLVASSFAVCCNFSLSLHLAIIFQH